MELGPDQGPGLDTVNLLHMQQATNITDLSMLRVQTWDSFVAHKLCESKLMTNCNFAVDNEKILDECAKNILGHGVSYFHYYVMYLICNIKL